MQLMVFRGSQHTRHAVHIIATIQMPLQGDHMTMPATVGTPT